MNDSVLLWVLNVVIQVTCISGVGLAVALLMRKRATATCWVLCSALLLILLSPVTAAVMQSLGRSLVSLEVHDGLVRDDTLSATLAADSLDAVAAVQSDVAVPVAKESNLAGGKSSDLALYGTPGSDAGDFGLNEAHRPAAESGSNTLTRAESSRGTTARWDASALSRWRLVGAMFCGLWLMGAALLLARLGVSWWRLRRILLDAGPNTNQTLARVFSSVCGALPLTRVPDLLLSHAVPGPVSAGCIRPRIVLPTGLAERVTEAHLHDILVHELAHILRRDQVTVLLQQLARAVYWFHPLVALMNRLLAQAREEACDNHVLATTSAASYSRTLLTLAELVSSRPLPGAVGLFTAEWKLESRVAGLLDERRHREVGLRRRAKLIITSLSLVMATVATLATVTLSAGQAPDQKAEPSPTQSDKSQEKTGSTPDVSTLKAGPKLRGAGDKREMLLRGRIFDVDGQPAREFDVVATMKGTSSKDILPVRVLGNEVDVWVPISGSDWRHLSLAAKSKDAGSLAVQSIPGYVLRQAAVDGVDIRMTPTNRTVEFLVTYKGAPVSEANVNAEVSVNGVLEGKTDANGRVAFRLREVDKLNSVTAWTEDFRIGGFQCDRKPRRDEAGSSFKIELEDCRSQKVRLLNAEDGSPVANLPFDLVLGTGKPNYNFVAAPATFPHSRMTTDEHGEAVCRWFPDWKTHGAYIEIIDPQWASAVSDYVLNTDVDGMLTMTLKRRIARKPFVGTVRADGFQVGGLLVEIKSFQGEEENRTDQLYAFTDEAGKFTAECIPGATYTVCVNDARLLSEMIHLIPYEPDTGKSNAAELEVRESNLVEIHVTSGPSRRPLRNQYVYIRQNHSYDWLENGEKKNGTGARNYPVYTDDRGVARARGLAGSELRVTVYAGEWRSGDLNVKVKPEGVTHFEIHRELDGTREVRGQLVAPPGIDVQLGGAEIIYGSIDGETDERESITADSEGRFTVNTQAIQLGFFVCTKDGKASATVKPDNLDRPLELHLKPTADLQGQLLGANNAPLANHPVYVTPRVSGKRDYSKSRATSFETKTFRTQTNAGGNYTLRNLPAELDMTVRAAPINGSQDDEHVDDFYLVVGEERPLMVSHLGRMSPPEKLTLAEEYDRRLRDAKLGGYHLLVLSYDADSESFVKAKLLDSESVREAMSFLNVRIDEKSLTEEADRQFAGSKNWPQPIRSKVAASALDATGKELGRIEFDSSQADSAAKAAEFLRQHAPAPADAKANWDAEFAEAKRSNRRVWARVGQRYCGPCFVFSRWLDDHREQLERDYVLLKVDDLRDKHGAEIAKRIVSNRERFGVPFHTIFDANERLVIDSESPIGNISHPSGFEGRRHLTKMLSQTRTNLTVADIEQIAATLKD